MADNTTLNSGSGGDTIATDDIAGVKYPRSKIVIGADGTNDGDVSSTNPMPVKGTGTAGTANAGVVTIQGITSMTPVQIGDNNGSITVDNTALSVVGGGVESTALRVTIASDSTGVLSVDDNGGSLTVDGTVAATQSGTWTVQPGNTANTTPWLTSIHDGTTKATVRELGTNDALNVAIVDGAGNQVTSFGGSGGTSSTDDAAFTAASGSGTPMMGFATSDVVDSGDVGVVAMTTARELKVQATNAGTFAVQATQSGTWTVQPGNTANTTAWLVTGTGGTFPVTDSGGSLTVDNGGTFAVQATIAAGATTIGKAEDVASADADVGVPSMAVRKATPANTSGTDGDYEMLQMSAGRLWTSTVIDTALPAGTNAIGKLASNTGVTIGAVEIASAQTLGTVTTVGTVTTCSTVTTVSTLTNGGVAHANGDSGNPHKIGAKAVGTLSTQTMATANDRTNLYADRDGVLIVRTDHTLADNVHGLAAITDGSSTSVITAPGAGIRVYVTDVIIANSSASNVTVDLRDGTAGSVLATFPVPANGGVVHRFNSPIGWTANTAVAADPSAAASTVTVTLSGFLSKL